MSTAEHDLLGEIGSDAWIGHKFRSLGTNGLPREREKSTWRGLGLSGLAMVGQTRFLGGQIAAEPVKAIAGTLDSVVAAGAASPAMLTLEAVVRSRGLQGPWSFSPVSDGLKREASDFYNFQIPVVKRYADKARDDLENLNRRIQWNRPEGPAGGFLYDAGTGGVQMLPGIGLGLATRSPTIAATAMAIPAAGGLVADGLEKGLTTDAAFRRATPVVAAETFIGRPVAALLTLPAKTLLAAGGVSGVMKRIVSSKRGRFAAGVTFSGIENAATQALQEAYDAGFLGQETTLGEALQRIGYSYLVGKVAATPFAATRVATDRRNPGRQHDEPPVREAAEPPLRRPEPRPVHADEPGPALQDYGVAFFGADNLRYYSDASVTLGSPGGRPFFFMPVEDSPVVRNAADAARLTGRAPSAENAWLGKSDLYHDIFGVSFPLGNLAVRPPAAADAMGWPHYLSGGHTAVRLGGANDGYLVNPTRERVTPGGNPMPRGAVLFQLGPDGEWMPLRRF